MTVTILGSNGKLGAVLASHARREGLGWRCQARTAAADFNWSGDFDAVPDNLFAQGGTLINMIGTTKPDAAVLHDTNVRFVQDLLAKAAQSGVAHVVLASSAAVYGDGDAPFDETAPLSPMAPYGNSKVAMEQAALAFGTIASPAITILRIGNVAGSDALSRVAQSRNADGTQMHLHRYEDGSAPVRSYIGPHDLFRAIKALTVPHEGAPRIVNITHPQPVALDDMLYAYRACIWPNLRWVDAPVPDGIPKVVTLSADKVQRFVKFDKYPKPAIAFVRQAADHRTP